MSTDRFAEKYPGLTPYGYAANNPVTFIDVNGDSINVAGMQIYDEANGTSHLSTLVTQLQEVTGLSLSVNDRGQLVYAEDEEGNAIIATDKNGNLAGSQTARDMLVAGIAASDNVFVSTIDHRGSVAGGNQIGLNPAQIGSFAAGVQGGLNPMTLDVGMTFLHEFQHTNLGGNLQDPRRFGATGPVVDRTNIIRAELGASYGQRTSYKGMELSPGGQAYIPFDRSSLRRLQAGRAPRSGSMFIQY